MVYVVIKPRNHQGIMGRTHFPYTSDTSFRSSIAAAAELAARVQYAAGASKVQNQSTMAVVAGLRIHRRRRSLLRDSPSPIYCYTRKWIEDPAAPAVTGAREKTSQSTTASPVLAREEIYSAVWYSPVTRGIETCCACERGKNSSATAAGREKRSPATSRRSRKQAAAGARRFGALWPRVIG